MEGRRRRWAGRRPVFGHGRHQRSEPMHVVWRLGPSGASGETSFWKSENVCDPINGRLENRTWRPRLAQRGAPLPVSHGRGVRLGPANSTPLAARLLPRVRVNSVAVQRAAALNALRPAEPALT